MVSHLQRRTLVLEPCPISVNGQKGQPSGYQLCPKGTTKDLDLIAFPRSGSIGSDPSRANIHCSSTQQSTSAENRSIPAEDRGRCWPNLCTLQILCPTGNSNRAKSGSGIGRQSALLRIHNRGTHRTPFGVKATKAICGRHTRPSPTAYQRQLSRLAWSKFQSFASLLEHKEETECARRRPRIQRESAI